MNELLIKQPSLEVSGKILETGFTDLYAILTQDI